MKRLLSQNKLRRVNSLLKTTNRSLPVFNWLSSVVRTLQATEYLETTALKARDNHLIVDRNFDDSNQFQDGKFQLTDEDFMEMLPANGYIH